MEPEVITSSAFLVAGALYEGKNENQEIAVMWSAFDPKIKTIKAVAGTPTYGVCEMDGSLPDGAFRYVAGVQIARPEDAPPEFFQINVPAGKYAVFKHIGSLEGLHQTYDRIYNEWLPQSGLKRAPGPDLEVYTQEFDDFKPNSVLHLWVPVE